MDSKALYKLSYGMYLLSSMHDGKTAGCVVNTVTQATSDPKQVLVTVNKENHTGDIISRSGVFAAVVLSEKADMELIGAFGFSSSRDTDKFSRFPVDHDLFGIPYVTQAAAAVLSCKVVSTMDTGTHITYLGKVMDAKVLSEDPPMTYGYYHSVLRGKTPPKASSYLPEESAVPPVGGTQWCCTFCGHVETADTLAEDFVCPICGQGRQYFNRV